MVFAQVLESLESSEFLALSQYKHTLVQPWSKHLT